MVNKLSDKQRSFTLRVFEAKQEPGQIYFDIYKVKSMAVASVCASKLLRIAKIDEYLKELRQKAEDDAIARSVEMQKTLTQIIRGRVSHFIKNNRISVSLGDIETAAVSECNTSEVQIGKGKAALLIEVTKLKLNDPIRAIDLLAKLQGLFPGTPGNVINIDNSDNRSVNIGVGEDAKSQLIAELNRFAGRIEAHRGDK